VARRGQISTDLVSLTQRGLLWSEEVRMVQPDLHRRLMREVNDRVRDVLREEGRSQGVFVCECNLADCTRTVTMSLDAYESIGNDRTALVAHGPGARTGQDEVAGSLG
jgi:hypothetical protein